MDKDLETQKKEVEVAEGAERTRATRVYAPRVDILSADDGIVISAEMPGVDENEVNVTLEKNILTIKGYISADEPEGYELAYSEYGVGDYERSFTLPDEIDRNNIEAAIEDGVLRVSLHKAPEAKARTITVQAG